MLVGPTGLLLVAIGCHFELIRLLVENDARKLAYSASEIEAAPSNFVKGPFKRGVQLALADWVLLLFVSLALHWHPVILVLLCVAMLLTRMMYWISWAEGAQRQATIWHYVGTVAISVFGYLFAFVAVSMARF